MSAIVFVKLRAVCVTIVRRFSSTLKRNKSYIFGATRDAVVLNRILACLVDERKTKPPPTISRRRRSWSVSRARPKPAAPSPQGSLEVLHRGLQPLNHLVELLLQFTRDPIRSPCLEPPQHRLHARNHFGHHFGRWVVPTSESLGWGSEYSLATSNN